METQGPDKTFLVESECVYLAAVASVTLRAGATEGLQGILTDASVEAGLGVTLIDLVLAVGASEA